MVQIEQDSLVMVVQTQPLRHSKKKCGIHIFFSAASITMLFNRRACHASPQCSTDTHTQTSSISPSLILVVNIRPLPPVGQLSLILEVNLHPLPPVGQPSLILAVNFRPSSCWTSFTYPCGQLPPLLLLDKLHPSCRAIRFFKNWVTFYLKRKKFEQLLAPQYG